jgi:hypothetical protein
MRLTNHGLVRTLALVALGFGLGWLLAPQAAQSGLQIGCGDPRILDVTCAGSYVVVGMEGTAITRVSVRDVPDIKGVDAKAVAFRAVTP